ncbi:MAG: putative toxin-antitoxin system toxin component, PIN family [Planctomycetota bacterium]
MRIVLDTNVLVSGLISRGPPALLLDLWIDDLFEVVTSNEQVLEVARVLCYPKLARRLSDEVAFRLVDRLQQAAVLVSDLPQVDASTDPYDNAILATAIAGKARLLVTGDKKHLLALGEIRGVAIVTVQDALARLSH